MRDKKIAFLTMQSNKSIIASVPFLNVNPIPMSKLPYGFPKIAKYLNGNLMETVKCKSSNFNLICH